MRYFFLYLVLLAGCKSCRKDDPCPGKATTANFAMYERSPFMNEEWKERFPDWKDLDTDTLLNNTVLLVAEQTGTTCDSVSYYWEIGAGIYTTKEVSITFNNFPRPPYIEAKLTVRKKPNRNCFPGDSGVAHLTRRLYFKDDFRESLLLGVYFGYLNDNPKDTCTYTIGPSYNQECGNLYWRNFPVRGEKTASGSIMISDVQFCNSGGYACIQNPIEISGDCYGTYDPLKNELKAWGRFSKRDGSLTSIRRFTGKKIKPL